VAARTQSIPISHERGTRTAPSSAVQRHVHGESAVVPATLEGKAGGLVRIKLEFITPFAPVADAEFTFSVAGNGTTVTWIMNGENDFVSKGFCLFMGGPATVCFPRSRAAPADVPS